MLLAAVLHTSFASAKPSEPLVEVSSISSGPSLLSAISAVSLLIEAKLGVQAIKEATLALADKNGDAALADAFLSSDCTQACDAS